MDEVVFLHKILPGGTDKSYGIHVAKLAGVPKTILDRSKEILDDLESTFQKEASGEHLSRHKTKESDREKQVRIGKTRLNRREQPDSHRSNQSAERN